MTKQWCKHNQNIVGEYHRCYICNPEERWQTEGFFETGGTLIRNGRVDRTLEEIKHLFTIPKLKMIKVTKIKRDVVVGMWRLKKLWDMVDGLAQIAGLNVMKKNKRSL